MSFVSKSTAHNKRLKHRALRALDSQQVARRLSERLYGKKFVSLFTIEIATELAFGRLLL